MKEAKHQKYILWFRLQKVENPGQENDYLFRDTDVDSKTTKQSKGMTVTNHEKMVTPEVPPAG